jgi:hypothetical protein
LEEFISAEEEDGRERRGALSTIFLARYISNLSRLYFPCFESNLKS